MKVTKYRIEKKHHRNNNIAKESLDEEKKIYDHIYDHIY